MTEYKDYGESRRKDSITVNGMIAAGFLLRLFYVLFSTIYDRQYDVGMIDLSAGHTVSGGHLAYIQYLYHNGHLADVDPTSIYQFHHPPFYYAVSALWLRIAGHFISDIPVLEESLQVIPFVCSLVTLLLLVKIAKLYGLRGKALACTAALFAFHPSLILMSGSVNNDAMGFLFSVLCIYSMMKWLLYGYRRRDILMLAFSMGFGIMTKQSVAEMAFPVGILFAVVFFRVLHGSLMEKRSVVSESGYSAPAWKQLLIQYAVFLLISVPLAMWFYIRNLVRFRMPIVWVYTLPEDSWQYVGNIPVINRFLIPPVSELFDNIRHFQIGCGYNVWMQVFRTSVLGEWDMAAAGKLVKILAVLLMFSGAVLAVLAFVCMVDVFLLRSGLYSDIQKKLKSRKDIDSGQFPDTMNDNAPGQPESLEIAAKKDIRWFLLLVYIVHMLFYLKFVYDYPQECSMNYRYITITLLTPALALGSVLQSKLAKLTSKVPAENSSEKMAQNIHVRLPFVARAAIIVLAVFCSFSVIMTAVWCIVY